MASTIDPTQPEDGVPASKADLRSNLQTAKTELDHGGFAEGLAPANYGPPATSRVSDHLAAIDAAFGLANSFVGLTDTPAAYAGQATRFVKVKRTRQGSSSPRRPAAAAASRAGWMSRLISLHLATAQATTRRRSRTH